MPRDSGSFRTEFYDPLTGDPRGIRFNAPPNDRLNDLLLELIHTPAMQRMASVSQLGFCHFKYGGEYSRFSHMLQAATLGRRDMDALEKQIAAKSKTDKKFKGVFDLRMADAVVIALLLHDIAHPPFSHVFEDIMRKIGLPFCHEEWAGRIIREDPGISRLLARYVDENPTYGQSFCNEYGCTFQEMIVRLIEGKAPIVTRKIDKKSIASTVYAATVSGAADADRLAFLLTDRERTGAYKGKHSFSDKAIVKHRTVAVLSIPGLERPVVVPAYEQSGKNDLVQLLNSWLLQYKSVYFPSVACAAEAMAQPILAACVAYATGERTTPLTPELDRQHPSFRNNPLFNFLADQSVQSYLQLDDRTVVTIMQDIAKNGHDPALKELASGLLRGEIWSSLKLHKVEVAARKNPERAARARRKLYQELQVSVTLSDGTILQNGVDYFYDSKKPRSINAAPVPTGENLSNIVWVLDNGKPTPIQEASGKLRRQQPLHKAFIHAPPDVTLQLLGHFHKKFGGGDPCFDKRVFHAHTTTPGRGLNTPRPFQM